MKTGIDSGGAVEGYIITAPKAEAQRHFTDPKMNWEPFPLDQIKLYQDIAAASYINGKTFVFPFKFK